ncbi:MAG: hypothetical protein ACXW0I_03740 [Methylosarcina sp.]
MTPTLSVEALQARLIAEAEAAVAENPLGVLGAEVSRVGCQAAWADSIWAALNNNPKQRRTAEEVLRAS